MDGFPKRYVVVDTESEKRRCRDGTIGHDHKLRLGVARFYDLPRFQPGGFETVHFDDATQLHAAIANMPYTKEHIYIFAHNMGFDSVIGGFWDALRARVYDIRPFPGMPKAGIYSKPLFVVDDRPFICRLFRPDHQILILLDTNQWFQRSLKDIGKLIGVEKTEVNFKRCSDEELRDYCANDVHVTDAALRWLWKWLKDHGMNWFDYTIAAQSMSLYRMRFQKKKIIRPDEMSKLALDRLGYFGALSECFYVGKVSGPIYHVDVNSLFPAVMRINRFPCELLDQDLSGKKRYKPTDLPLAECTAEVLLNADWHHYPVRGEDGVIYCQGHVRTVLCGPELVDAFERGHIKHILRYSHYRLDDLFSAFMGTMNYRRMQCRKAGDELGDWICKTLMNCLYGKFGQRDGAWEWKGFEGRHRMFGEGMASGDGVPKGTMQRELDGHIFWRVMDQEGSRSFVPIAAWVTADARRFMDKIRLICGEGTVLYQAVDALMITHEGYENLKRANLIDPDQMGKLKDVDEYDWMEIMAKNAIVHSKGEIAGGISKRRVKIKDLWFEVEDWETCAHAIFSGQLSTIRVKKMAKHMSDNYFQRRVRADGWTEPHWIDNWDLTPEQQRTERVISAEEDG